jgi:GntR family transcriptional regulator, transcriptional repressor for pyruvate dehydrogenase complex
VAAPLTETAIERLRELIASGTLRPGDRLPPEAELAAQLGASRNTVREAVRALVTARVLDVRRGDGTYVTSLRPELLFDGIAFAAEMLQADYSLELIAVRRILEGAASGLAARNIDAQRIAELTDCLDHMRQAETHEVMVEYDEQFHALVAAAAGNATLASLLAGVSSQTIRARVWRGNVDRGVVARTISQHEDILTALVAGDPELAEATATVHVATTEAWIRSTMAAGGWSVDRRDDGA